MMDTVAIQAKTGELCHQFKLPTMGARSVSRLTAAGHGDTLETLPEVLEQLVPLATVDPRVLQVPETIHDRRALHLHHHSPRITPRWSPTYLPLLHHQDASAPWPVSV